MEEVSGLEMDASGRSSSSLHSIRRGTLSSGCPGIGPSNEAVASNSLYPSGFILGMGVVAFDPRSRSPDRGTWGVVRRLEMRVDR